MKLVIGITGASGAIYALQLLNFLREHTSSEIHLVISNPGEIVIEHELEMSKKEFQNLASFSYEINDFFL